MMVAVQEVKAFETHLGLHDQGWFLPRLFEAKGKKER